MFTKPKSLTDLIRELKAIIEAQRQEIELLLWERRKAKSSEQQKGAQPQ
jgi:hypothetical protein